MDHLKKIDMFGVPLTFNLNSSAKYHQSRFGGIFTFLVYSLVLTYAVMNLRTWAIGNLLPTITTQRSAILDQHVPHLSQLQVTLTLQSYKQGPRPALNNQWFMILYGANNTVVPMQNTTTYDFVMDFVISDNQTEINSESWFTILSCDPKKITVGTCANNNTVASYLQQNSYYFSMQFNLTYINPNNFEVSVVKQIAYISLEQGQAHFSTINLGATLFQMQKPAIIQSTDYFYAFTSQKQYIETFQQKYAVNAYRGDPIFGSFYIYSFFSLDFVADQVTMQYPSIFTVLGNIGAIGGILLYLKYVIMFHNSREAERILIDTVTKMLYPKYEEIKVTKRFNVIKQVTFLDKVIDTTKFIKFEEQMREKIIGQFTLPQLIINQIQLNDFIKQIHPDYQYKGDDFDWLISSQEELDCQLDDMENKIIALPSLGIIDEEPQRQTIR